MALGPSGASATNAHIIDIASAADLRRHLAEILVDDGEASALTDSFLSCTLKLEGVDSRAAGILRARVEALGGAVAMRREARELTVRETDVLVSGTRAMYKLLASQLKGEPYRLPEIAAELQSRSDTGSQVMSWGTRRLDFGARAYVMGILNATPDSFYPGSRSSTLADAADAARGMVDAGVDIIDVGGESSRPGSDPVSTEEEIRRVVPAVEAVRSFSDVIVSVDTRKAEVAERALDAGADMVNDISGLRHNPAMAGLVARRDVPIVLMHMRGTPKTMQKNPSYRSAVSEILRELEPSVVSALRAGIARERIMIDPGIGFGKRVQDNLRIIRELSSFRSLGFPVLVGLSRKAFLGELLDAPVEDRLAGTVAANTLAVVNGADIVRVHDVREAVQAVTIVDAVRRAGVPRGA